MGGNMDSDDITIGFVGAGNMANALIKGLTASGTYSQRQLAVSDNDPEKLTSIYEKFGLKGYTSNIQLVEASKVILLAVKPQVIKVVLEEIKHAIKEGHLIVSIAAGIPIKMIQSIIGNNIPIIRVMPNTPALIQKGISAIAGGGTATSSHMDIARKVFEAVGKTIVVDEQMMDAVTALSGSGPGYLFRIMELLTAAARKYGFDDKTSLLLVIQTVLGSAHLADESELSLSRLREMVTSPGGTTAAALDFFEEKGLGDIIEGAIDAAYRRSTELGKGIE
jgi:pyrroline-5-carboxylate reductase